MRMTPITTRLSELFNELRMLPEPADELGRVGRQATQTIAAALYLLDTAEDSTPSNLRASALKFQRDLAPFARTLGEHDRAVRIVREMIALAAGEKPPPISTSETFDDLDDEAWENDEDAIAEPSRTPRLGPGGMFCPQCHKPKTTCIECPYCAEIANETRRAQGGKKCQKCEEYLNPGQAVCENCGAIAWAIPIRQSVVGATVLLGVFVSFFFLSSWTSQIPSWIGLVVALVLMRRAQNTWFAILNHNQYAESFFRQHYRNDPQDSTFKMVVSFLLFVGIPVEALYVSCALAPNWRLRSVLAENSEARYLEYLRECPSRQHFTVRNALVALRWQNALQSDTIRAYQTFLQTNSSDMRIEQRNQAQKRLTEKRQDLARSFKSILDGKGIPEARERDHQPRKLLLLDSTGQLHAWQAFVAPKWQPEEAGDVSFVVVLGSPSESVLEVCQYVGGPPITRYACSLKARVYEARTAKQIEEKFFENIARPCAAREPVSLTRLGDPVSFENVRSWIDSLLETPRKKDTGAKVP